MDENKTIKIEQIISEVFKDAEKANKEKEFELVKNLLLAVHYGDIEGNPLKVYLVNPKEGSFFISQIYGFYLKGSRVRPDRFQKSFVLNHNEACFTATITQYKGREFTIRFNFFVTTQSKDTYKVISEISNKFLENAEEIKMEQLPIERGRYFRLSWSSVEKDDGLLTKTDYDNNPEHIAALNIQIRERMNDYLSKQRLEKIEETYRLAKTEIAIDKIIKEAKNTIKKIPIFKARPLSKLERKVDYLEGEKKRLAKKRKKLKEEQDELNLATKI